MFFCSTAASARKASLCCGDVREAQLVHPARCGPAHVKAFSLSFGYPNSLPGANVNRPFLHTAVRNRDCDCVLSNVLCVIPRQGYIPLSTAQHEQSLIVWKGICAANNHACGLQTAM